MTRLSELFSPQGAKRRRSALFLLTAAALCLSVTVCPLAALADEEAEGAEEAYYEEAVYEEPAYVEPEVTPEPTPTPTPSPTPTPEPTPEPTEEPAVTPEAVTETESPAESAEPAEVPEETEVPAETSEPTEDPAATEEPAQTPDPDAASQEPVEDASQEPEEDDAHVGADDADAELEEDEDDGETVQGGDPTADVETIDYMESTVPFSKLTGVWSEDILTVAYSQLGYRESSRNYIINSAGKYKGYTRYGAWFGDTYGDWCAMFVSFCLYYAGVPAETFPRYGGCPQWSEVLKAQKLWAPADCEDVAPGDIIFFDRNHNNIADHVGIVYDVYQDQNGAWWLDTIEGNSSNRVQIVTYPRNYAGFFGFGLLPSQEEPSPEIDLENCHVLVSETDYAAPLDCDFSAYDAVDGFLLPRSMAAAAIVLTNSPLAEMNSDGGDLVLALDPRLFSAGDNGTAEPVVVKPIHMIAGPDALIL